MAWPYVCKYIIIACLSSDEIVRCWTGTITSIHYLRNSTTESIALLADRDVK